MSRLPPMSQSLLHGSVAYGLARRRTSPSDRKPDRVAGYGRPHASHHAKQNGTNVIQEGIRRASTVQAVHHALVSPIHTRRATGQLHRLTSGRRSAQQSRSAYDALPSAPSAASAASGACAADRNHLRANPISIAPRFRRRSAATPPAPRAISGIRGAGRHRRESTA